MQSVRLHKTVGVKVGHVQVGGGAPVVVQSMTMTDTADAAGTAQQCIELVEAGSEMVRVTVNVPEAAAASRRRRLAGWSGGRSWMYESGTHQVFSIEIIGRGRI